MNTRTTNHLARLFRSIMAGALGGPLFLLGVVVFAKLLLAYALAGILPVLLVGAAYGTVVGIVFWVLAAKAIYPSIGVRAIIGLTIPLIFIMIPLLRSGRTGLVDPATPTGDVTFGLLYVVCFGALPGIASYTKRKESHIRGAT